MCSHHCPSHGVTSDEPDPGSSPSGLRTCRAPCSCGDPVSGGGLGFWCLFLVRMWETRWVPPCRTLGDSSPRGQEDRAFLWDGRGQWRVFVGNLILPFSLRRSLPGFGQWRGCAGLAQNRVSEHTCVTQGTGLWHAQHHSAHFPSSSSFVHGWWAWNSEGMVGPADPGTRTQVPADKGSNPVSTTASWVLEKSPRFLHPQNWVGRRSCGCVSGALLALGGLLESLPLS